MPFSFAPNEYLVLLSAPLTFLTSKDLSSLSVKSKTYIFSALEILIKKNEINKNLKKNFRHAFAIN